MHQLVLAVMAKGNQQVDLNGIKKLQKNISSELLASFGRQLTETEDIAAQLKNSVQN